MLSLPKAVVKSILLFIFISHDAVERRKLRFYRVINLLQFYNSSRQP